MTRKQPFTPDQFRRIYSQVPRVCVDLVIIHEGKILLLKREEKSWHGQWHFPGGTIFYQEKVEDAVRRIAQEELHLEIEIEKLLGYIEYPSEEEERGFGYSIALTFLCRPTSELRTGNQEPWQFFDQIPQNTVAEQAEFLEKMQLL